MIHGAILFMCVSCVISILIHFHYFLYTSIVALSFIPFFIYKIIYHSKNKLVHMIIFCCVFCLIYISIGISITQKNNLYMGSFLNDSNQTVFVGQIVEFPQYRFSNNQYTVELQDTHTRISIFTDGYQKYTFDDVIEFKGNLHDVRTEEDQWRVYYKRLNIQYVIFRPTSLKIIETHTFKKHILYKKIFIFKNKIRTIYLNSLSSHASALILGMILGEKNELSKDEKDMFNKAGISHILVVSGYNISILISAILVASKSLRQNIQSILCIGCIILFVLLVGADASVVRAALMGSIFLFSKIFYRQKSAVNVLFLVAFIMLFYNPSVLFDVSFHLSFIATFSLLIAPSFRQVPELVMTPLWVFLFVSVYIAYFAGYVSFGSIVSNIFISFFIPVCMLGGFSIMIISFLSFNIGIDVFIVETISRYIFLIANSVQRFPLLNTHISACVCLVVYTFFISGYIFLKNRYTTQEFIEKYYQKFVPQNSN